MFISTFSARSQFDKLVYTYFVFGLFENFQIDNEQCNKTR